MPHTWNNILVVTKEELVPNWWRTYNNLRNELWRYKDKSYGLTRAQLGGNGRQLLIRFDSLPKHVQEGLGNPDASKHPLEQFYTIDADAVRFYSNYERPNYGALKIDEYERYIINASVIKAIVQLESARLNERLTKGGSRRASTNTKSIAETLLNDAQTFQEVLKSKYDVQHSLPMHPRHFKKKIKDFQEHKYVSLIKDPMGKKIGNAKKINDYTQKILNALFGTQTTKPSATEIARQYDAFLDGYLEIINPKTGEVFSNKGLKELSSSSIVNYLHSWESKIGTFAKRSGNRQVLMQQFEPYHSLEKPHFAGSIISIDDRQPPFYYNKSKDRMWFYIGIDLASECFTTIVWGKSKEGIILEFYRQMVRNYAEWGLQLPAELECESSLNSSFTNSFLKEGVMFDTVRIEANKARAKKIERYFGNLRYDLEKHSAGWVARPFAKSEKNQIGSEKIEIIPYPELVQARLKDLQQWNNTAHSESKSISRWDYFLQNQNPDLKPTNYKALLPQLGYHTVTSCNAGMIKLQNKEWLLGANGSISTGETLIDLMRKVETKTIDIYWLDNNEGEVFIAYIYIDTQFICEAHPKPIYPRARIERKPHHEELRDIMTRYASTIQGFQRLQKNELEQVFIVDNRKKTVNDNFKIRGLKTFEDTENSDQGSLIDNFEEPQEVFDIADVEILEDFEEIPLNEDLELIPINKNTTNQGFGDILDSLHQ